MTKKQKATSGSNTYTFISVGATLTLIWVGILFSLVNYSSIKEVKNDTMTFIEKLTFAIEKSEIIESRSANFITRPKIEEKISNALTYEYLKSDSYTIVYGPKGIGKTELVDHTAIGKKGVVKVKVSSPNTRSDVIQAITEKLLGETTYSDFDIDILIEAVKKSIIIPTIIFDIERAASPHSSHDHVVYAVRSLSKELAPYCRCIIVLSEANAVQQFGKDEREEFIYVDEMEREEAEQLLEKLGRKLTDTEKEYVFTNIGTSPLKLINLDKRVSSTYSLQDYVADVLTYAKNSLVEFPHQPILKALKDHSEGIFPKYFKKQKDEGVDLSHPAAVGVAMKSVNAIVYRMELNIYMLMSTAHRTALQSYEPILK